MYLCVYICMCRYGFVYFSLCDALMFLIDLRGVRFNFDLS